MGSPCIQLQILVPIVKTHAIDWLGTMYGTYMLVAPANAHAESSAPIAAHAFNYKTPMRAL